MISKIDIEEGLNILNDNIKSLGYEKVHICNALGRTIAKDIHSTINNPPFDKSAMDGYAIKVSDNSKLKVVGCIYAGDTYSGEINEDKALKIMTGAPIPRGANAVVKKEDVVICGDHIILNKRLSQNSNICLLGEDIKIGDKLVIKNKKLDYADIGIIASSGIEYVEVYKKPRIGLINTGDELVEVGMTLPKGKIYNSNKYTIWSRIRELGYELSTIEYKDDNIEKIANRIESLSNKLDVIITTGGVSVGDKDFMGDVIKYIGGRVLFWKINMKPGSAILCSKYKDTLIISLSGNPSASLTTFELFVKPALNKLSGNGDVILNKEKAILLEGYNINSKLKRYVRGNYICNEKGQYVGFNQKKRGNGILSTALNSNCLIEIESSTERLEQGDIVNIIKL